LQALTTRPIIEQRRVQLDEAVPVRLSDLRALAQPLQETDGRRVHDAPLSGTATGLSKGPASGNPSPQPPPRSGEGGPDNFCPPLCLGEGLGGGVVKRAKGCRRLLLPRYSRCVAASSPPASLSREEI